MEAYAWMHARIRTTTESSIDAVIIIGADEVNRRRLDHRINRRRISLSIARREQESEEK